MRQRQEEKGSSAWHLVLIFLVAVAVCGVFFSLGYVVGYNHRPARASTETETVAPGGNIPPTVNAPQSASGQSSASSMTTESLPATPSMAPPAVRPKPQPQAETQEKAHPASKPVVTVRARKKPEREKAAPAKRQPEHHVVHHATEVRRGRYAVQVIASRTKADAVTLLRLLEDRHYPVFLAPPARGQAGRKLYRVQVGPFTTRTQARRALHELENDGFKPFVVHQ